MFDSANSALPHKDWPISQGYRPAFLARLGEPRVAKCPMPVMSLLIQCAEFKAQVLIPLGNVLNYGATFIEALGDQGMTSLSRSPGDGRNRDSECALSLSVGKG